MKHIYTHDNIIALHSAKNILALHGIESFVKNEYTVPVGASHGINNIFLELWILNDQDHEVASSILENEIDTRLPKDSWTCLNCGEDNDGNFDACWNCQNVPPDTCQTVEPCENQGKGKS